MSAQTVSAASAKPRKTSCTSLCISMPIILSPMHTGLIQINLWRRRRRIHLSGLLISGTAIFPRPSIAFLDNPLLGGIYHRASCLLNPRSHSREITNTNTFMDKCNSIRREYLECSYGFSDGSALMRNPPADIAARARVFNSSPASSLLPPYSMRRIS